MTSPSKVIPAEAVDAAVTAAWIEADMPDDVTKDVARRMIEAAAPHMLGPLLDDLRRERAKVELLLEGVE